MRSELEDLREALAERDAELGRLREAAAREETRRPIAAAGARSQERLEAGLAEATERYQAAEAALAEARRRVSDNSPEEVNRLNGEIATLRTMLAESKTALARARSLNEAAEQEKKRSRRKAEGETAPRGSGIFRDMVIVAAVAAAAFYFYPQILASLPYEWQARLPAAFIGADSDGPDAVSPEAAPGAGKSPASAQHLAVATRDVNLRSGPSVKSDAVTTLTHGTEVTQLEHKGSWTLVRLPAKANGQAPRQGWVYNSYLKAKADKTSSKSQDK